MTTIEKKVGDVVVEALGAELRFWAVLPEGKVRMFAKSFAFMGERVMQSVTLDGPFRAIPAKELTGTKVYKNKVAGAALVRKFVGELTGTVCNSTVHLYYSGTGPSGQRWGFAEPESIPV